MVYFIVNFTYLPESYKQTLQEFAATVCLCCSHYIAIMMSLFTALLLRLE